MYFYIYSLYKKLFEESFVYYLIQWDNSFNSLPAISWGDSRPQIAALQGGRSIWWSNMVSRGGGGRGEGEGGGGGGGVVVNFEKNLQKNKIFSL
jgi:hypothetical protein